MSKPTPIRELKESDGISQLESGTRQPSIGSLRQLSRALGCKMSKLLGLLPQNEG